MLSIRFASKAIASPLMKYEVLRLAGDFRSLSEEFPAGQKGAVSHGHPETYRQ